MVDVGILLLSLGDLKSMYFERLYMITLFGNEKFKITDIFFVYYHIFNIFNNTKVKKIFRNKRICI